MQRCLVLELCPGGALSSRLSNELKVEPVSLSLSRLQRLQIALGIARGLVYLHSLSPPMVHRDVKSGNVLLTKVQHTDMAAVTKVADFGTVRADVCKLQSQNIRTGHQHNKPAVSRVDQAADWDALLYACGVHNIWTRQ